MIKSVHLKNKLREIEQRRNQEVPITIEMIQKCGIQQLLKVEALIDELKIDDSNKEEKDSNKIEVEEGEDIKNEIENESKDNEKEAEQQQKKDDLEIYNSFETTTIENMETLQYLHLEFKNITKIANLDTFINLQSLYLQHNRISVIEGLENLTNLQFLALQNNQIKELKNISHLQSLYFLNLSYNKIASYSEKDLPESLLILKLHHNPCETQMENYRKSAILHCKNLEEMDTVEIHISERMHYQGLIKINLDKQLTEIKEKREEEEIKAKLEDEVMEEYLNENGLLEDNKTKKKELREENWDAFQSLKEFKELNDGFIRVKRDLDKNRRIVKSVTHQRRVLLYEHYQNLDNNYVKELEENPGEENESNFYVLYICSYKERENGISKKNGEDKSRY